MRIRKFTIVVLVVLSCICYGAQEEIKNLIINGGFTQTDKGIAVGWILKRGALIVNEKGNKFLRCPKNNAGATQSLIIDPKWKKLHFSCRLRSVDIVKGKLSWQNGRVALEYRGSDKKHIGGWTKMAQVEGSSEWTDYSFDLPVTVGAKELWISPCMLGISGVLDIDDISITVVE